MPGLVGGVDREGDAGWEGDAGGGTEPSAHQAPELSLDPRLEPFVPSVAGLPATPGQPQCLPPAVPGEEGRGLWGG